MKRCDLCGALHPQAVEQCECGSYVFSPDETESLLASASSAPPASVDPRAIARARLQAGHSPQQTEQDLVGLGLAPDDAAAMVRRSAAELRREAAREEGRRMMVQGGVLCLLGAAVTGLTYTLAVAWGEGSYIVAWGVIAYGLVRFLQGVQRKKAV